MIEKVEVDRRKLLEEMLDLSRRRADEQTRLVIEAFADWLPGKARELGLDDERVQFLADDMREKARRLFTGERR